MLMWSLRLKIQKVRNVKSQPAFWRKLFSKGWRRNDERLLLPPLMTLHVLYSVFFFPAGALSKRHILSGKLLNVCFFVQGASFRAKNEDLRCELIQDAEAIIVVWRRKDTFLHAYARDLALWGLVKLNLTPLGLDVSHPTQVFIMRSSQNIILRFVFFLLNVRHLFRFCSLPPCHGAFLNV